MQVHLSWVPPLSHHKIKGFQHGAGGRLIVRPVPVDIVARKVFLHSRLWQVLVLSVFICKKAT